MNKTIENSLTNINNILRTNDNLQNIVNAIDTELVAGTNFNKIININYINGVGIAKSFQIPITNLTKFDEIINTINNKLNKIKYKVISQFTHNGKQIYDVMTYNQLILNNIIMNTINVNIITEEMRIKYGVKLYPVTTGLTPDEKMVLDNANTEWKGLNITLCGFATNDSKKLSTMFKSIDLKAKLPVSKFKLNPNEIEFKTNNKFDIKSKMLNEITQSLNNAKINSVQDNLHFSFDNLGTVGPGTIGMIDEQYVKTLLSGLEWEYVITKCSSKITHKCSNDSNRILEFIERFSVKEIEIPKSDQLIVEFYDYVLEDYPVVDDKNLHLNYTKLNDPTQPNEYNYKATNVSVANNNMKLYCKDPIGSVNPSDPLHLVGGGNGYDFTQYLYNYVIFGPKQSNNDKTDIKRNGNIPSLTNMKNNVHVTEIIKLIDDLPKAGNTFTLTNTYTTDKLYCQRINLNQNVNYVIMGDLHGSYHGFIRCLLRLSLFGALDLNTYKIHDDYKIVLLGDIISYGRAFDILNILIKLIVVNNDGNVNNNKVIITKGNHENDFYFNFQSEINDGLKIMFDVCESLDGSKTPTIKQCNKKDDELNIKTLLSENMKNFFNKLPTCVVLEDNDSIIYLSHGGGFPKNDLQFNNFIKTNTQASIDIDHNGTYNSGEIIQNGRYHCGTVKSKNDVYDLTYNDLDTFLNLTTKTILIVRGHEDKVIQGTGPVHDWKIYNTTIYGKKMHNIQNEVSIEDFNNGIGIRKIISSTVNHEFIGNSVNLNKEIVFFKNNDNDNAYNCTGKFIPTKTSSYYYPVITTVNNTGNSREMICDSFIVVKHVAKTKFLSTNCALSGINNDNKKNIKEKFDDCKLITNLSLYQNTSIWGSKNCENCMIRVFNDINEIIPVNFPLETIEDMQPTTSNQTINNKLHFTSFKHLFESSVHSKGMWRGNKQCHTNANTTPTDMLYLNGRESGKPNCNFKSKATGNTWGCGSAGAYYFGMTMYTINVFPYTLLSYVENPGVTLKFKTKQNNDKMKILFIKSYDITNRLPLFNSNHFDTGTINDQYSKMWEQLDTTFDVIVVSNVTDWQSNSDDSGKNYAAFQVDYTKSGVNKLEIDKMIAFPTNKLPTRKKATFLDNKQYNSTYCNKINNVKLNDFDFNNIPYVGVTGVDLKTVRDTIMTYDPIPAKFLEIGQPPHASTNAIYKKNEDIFSNLKLIKDIPKYNYML